MFIVFWRRWGILGLAFLLVGFLLAFAVGAVIKASLHTTDLHGWWGPFGIVVGFGLGAFANWLFAVLLVEPRLDRPNAVSPPPVSTLYFMRLRYWTWVIVAVGVVFFVPNFLAAL